MGQGRSAVLLLGYWAGIGIKGSFCSPPGFRQREKEH